MLPVRRHYPSMNKRTGEVAAGTAFASHGSMEVRLARNLLDIRRAEHLRYKIFFEEMSAIPSRMARLTQRDEDEFDKICDHLMVLEHATPGGQFSRLPWGRKSRVVGTYRLLRQDMAEEFSGFYSQNEFDLAPLIERHGPKTKFLEVGRSCVMKEFRTKSIIELLWQGIWSYVNLHKLDVMIGCASLTGTDPDKLSEQLSFLHHFGKPPPQWQTSAHAHLRVDMNMIPKEKINPRQVLRTLPPQIKGYLRAGAYIGDGAVVDHQFGTTDVLIILPVADIKARYANHYRHKDKLAKAN